MLEKSMPLNPKTYSLLNAALDKRKSLRRITNAVRIVNGLGDDLAGLIVEQYDKHFVAQIFQEYWLKEVQSLEDFLKKQFDVEYFIVKDRTQSALSNPEAMRFNTLIEKASSRTIVSENHLKFEVDLNDTLNTGLFLDMRANRLLVGEKCKNKKVLNSFSYTCSFGVYARAHGAKEVVNVDISKKILDKGRYNYELNGLLGSSLEFIRADAMDYFARAVKKDNRFDVIIIDPPSFARADKKIFNVQKDLSTLIANAGKVLNKDGSLFISTNFSELSHGKLEAIISKGTQKPKKIIRLGQDKDFVGTGLTKESHLAALWVEY
jgi:23S rRNA (cytosine1962-C5)-methyltransferase